MKMETKLQSLHFVRWFLHLMGNRCMMPCPSTRGAASAGMTGIGPARRRRRRTSIKLIMSDGVVKLYHQPIQVSKLMLEFPKHMVCSSDSFYIGQKIPALSEHDHLQPGNNYFLLPKHLFQTVLSFVTITSFIAVSQCQWDDHLKKVLVRCQPFHIYKTSSGYLQVNVSEEFISQLMEQGKVKDDDNADLDTSSNKSPTASKIVLCTTRQLQKDFTQLVGPRHWKPKLDTIKETREKRKMAPPCPIKRSRKISTQALQKSRSHSGKYSTPASRVSPIQSSSNKKMTAF